MRSLGDPVPTDCCKRNLIEQVVITVWAKCLHLGKGLGADAKLIVVSVFDKVEVQTWVCNTKAIIF